MRVRYSPRLFAGLLGASALVVLGGLVTARSHAVAGGVIVFASDRAKSNPGEIYSLAPATRARDVSRSLAADYELAVAPVGDQIAFWSSRSGSDQIYLARSDGSHLRRVRALARRLAPVNAGQGGPLVFSADGERLFVSLSPGAFLVDTRLATARALGFCDAGAIEPAPDGRLVACGERGRTIVTDVAGRVRLSFPGQHPIWSSRGLLTNQPDQGSSQQRISAPVFDGSGRRLGRVSGQPLGWSPDGRLLVFKQDRSLRVAGPAGFQGSRLLLRNWDGNGPVSFSPDNRWVSTEDGKGHALIVPLAGGPPRPGLDFGLGAWSRDGRLAYVDYQRVYPVHAGVEASVLVTDTHGRNPRLVGRFPYDDHALGELHWLAGGRRVLFLTSNSCFGKGLFAVPASGGATRTLTHDPRDLEAPAWSPDGSRIAYSVQTFSCHLGAGQAIHLETVSANGRTPRRVTDSGDAEQGSFDSNPSFSPDGKRIVFDHATFNDVSLQIATLGSYTRAQLLAPGTTWPGAPAWSPDGSTIAYLKGRSIMAIPASGGRATVLATNPTHNQGLCGAGGLAWAPDGKRIAVADGLGIYLVTLAQPATGHLTIRARCAESPSFSPDGNEIAFDAPPPHALGGQTAIMVAGADGSNLRTLSTLPFRQSVHPSWQPNP